MAHKNSRLAPKVTSSTPLQGLNLYSLRTGVKDVVTLRGSFLGGDIFSSANVIVPEMTTSMLDLGTGKRDKFEIGDALESVGAKVGFSCDTYRVHFSGRCLRKDVPLVIELLAEQLRTPAFNESDLSSVMRRRIAELRKSKEDTRTRAIEAFLQRLYPTGHPNHPRGIDRQIASLEKVTPDLLHSFHEESYGLGTVEVCVVGDVDHGVIEKEIQGGFNGWQRSPLTSEGIKIARANVFEESASEVITIPDKTSADVVMGHGIGIDREHEDYYSAMMAYFILGGNFSARLMATVRDQEGLTYGLHAATGGVDEGNDGYWHIWAAFAPDLVDQGRESIDKQLLLWHRDGVTAEELASKKTTIGGLYQVGLDTTAGLATRILTTVERGKELSFMDEYPEIINALTLDHVNEAIRKYCDPDQIMTVIAGTLDGAD